MRKLLTAAVAALSTAFAAPAAAQEADVNTSSTGTQAICCYGPGSTDTYGQSFTITDPSTLEGFSLFLRGVGNSATATDLRGYVGVLNGTSISSILYASPLRTIDAVGNGSTVELSFDTSLALGAGSYAVFLSSFGVNGSTYFSMPYSSGTADVIAGTDGRFIYSNGDPTLASTNWNLTTIGADDAWVKLDFEGVRAAAVPEPATWAMMLFGFGAVGFQLRRKRPALLRQLA